MPKKSEPLTPRVTRLEGAMAQMAETMNVMGEKINILIDSQIRIDREMEAMNQRTDERINKLVSAIGELISRIPPQSLR